MKGAATVGKAAGSAAVAVGTPVVRAWWHYWAAPSLGLFAKMFYVCTLLPLLFRYVTGWKKHRGQEWFGPKFILTWLTMAGMFYWEYRLFRAHGIPRYKYVWCMFGLGPDWPPAAA